MNRVIKFRAWEKKANLMHDVIVIQRDEFIAVPEVGPNGWELSKRKIADVELMQFTGLLDKNGKEIYEEDILLFTKEGRKPGQTKRASEKHYWTVYFDGKGQWRTRREGDLPRALHDQSHSHEIIGNVFENPGLLSQDKFPNK